MNDIIITHCKHGLDLRLHARCWLCRPLGAAEASPFAPTFPGCQCPTFWLGIMPPPCPVHNPPTYSPNTTTYVADRTS